MKTIRPLLAAVAAALAMLAFAGTASATVTGIQGQYVDLYANGLGRYDLDFTGHHGGEDSSVYSPSSITNGAGDAGVTLTIYNSDETSATTYGFRGQLPFSQYVAPHLANPLAAGTVLDPFVLVSSYVAGSYDAAGNCTGNPCLKITENFQYGWDGNPNSESGDDVLIKYHVDNEGSLPVKFRLTATADVYPGYDDGGLGFKVDRVPGTQPQILGTQNAASGASIAFQESGARTFTHWQEDTAYRIYARIQRPLSSGLNGLADTVNPDYSDKAAAAEWDDFKSVGLDNTDNTADFQYLLKFHDWAPLTFSDPQPFGSPKLASDGASVTVQTTAADYAGAPVNAPVRWRVSNGPNTTAGSYSEYTRVTASAGHADLTWQNHATQVHATPADNAQAFVDLNDDGVQQSWEPFGSRNVYWYDQVEINPDYDDPTVGNNDPIEIDTYDAATKSPTNLPFIYKVSGTNTQGTGGTSTPVGGITCDPITGPCNYPYIDLTSLKPGDDFIDVWVNLDSGSDSDYTDPGEHQRIKIRWYSYYIGLDPESQAVNAGTTAHIDASIRDTSYNPVIGEQLHYLIEGTNAHSEQLTSATVSDDFGDFGVAPIDIPGAAGQYGQSKVTVWQEIDNDPGPTAGDVIATSYVDWALSPAQRLTLTPDATSKTVGGPTPGTVTTNLLGDDGTADATPYDLRYSISSGPDAFSGERKVVNGSGGHATIPLTGTKRGTDYITVYADYNGNGYQDGGEPYASTNVAWHDPIESYDDGDTYFTSGQTAIYVDLRTPSGAPATSGTQFGWSVTNGPNQGQNGTVLTGQNFLPGNEGRIVYPGGTTTGTDTVHITYNDGTSTKSKDIFINWTAALTIGTTPTDVSTGATISVPITLVDPVTGDPAPAGTPIAYRVYGFNSKVDSVETDGAGHATIQWTPTTANYNDLTAWADYDKDGVQDNNEPTDYAYIQVHNRVEITPDYDNKPQGNTENVTVNFRDDNYQPLASQVLTYNITGPNGVTGKTVTTNSSGVATISWKGDEQTDQNGYNEDQLVVFKDLNANGTPDAGERVSDPMQMYWSSRLNEQTYQGSRNTGQTETATWKLVGLDGTTPITGATLNYEITGANPQTGTITTNGSGIATLSYGGLAGGYDNIKVWQDNLTANGQRDVGEPVNTDVSVYWYSQITFSPTQATPKFQGPGQTQLVTVSNTNNYPMRYSVSGANDVAETAVPGSNQITLTGANPGYDYLYVYGDANNDGNWDSGEPEGYFVMTWKSRIGLAGGSGGHVAGGHVQITATLLDNAGNPVLNTPTGLKYKVEGANPTPGNQTITTSNLGTAIAEWDGDNQGSDLITVWKDDNANGQVDSGEFVATKYVYWSAPPVVLTLNHVGGTSTLQKNPAGHDVNATLTGMTLAAPVTLYWTVTGANPASGNVTINTSGVSTSPIHWTGANDGQDTLSAYIDVSGAHPARDGYDPGASTQFTWNPLVQGSATTSDQTAGEQHTETIRVLDPADPTGNTGLDNIDVYYTITGANPTSGGFQLARPIDAGGLAKLAKTSGGGYASISWTGSNPAGGTDTLDAWGDIDGTPGVSAGDAHTQRVVTWRTATAAVSGGTTPIGTTSAVTPGSANDFDGLPTPPPPVVAKTVNVTPVSGHVFVRLPGKKTFIELLDAESIPVGSIVDVRKGTVALTSAQNLKGGVATAQFYAGQFQIAQKKAAKPVTDLNLYGGSFAKCGKAARKSSAGTSQKKKVRELWGKGKGLFRTKGKYAAAAIRGTKWDVVDYCDGTLVKVAEGVVTVEPIKGKSRIVKAPKSLFVPVAGLSKKKG